jgi:hypothetical protein
MPKTFKRLYPRIYAFENLYQAFRKARRGGKRKKERVAAFELDLEANLWRLYEELCTQSYRPGPYHNFYVLERKLRLISAAPFRDRVVHHALCNVIQPTGELQPQVPVHLRRLWRRWAKYTEAPAPGSTLRANPGAGHQRHLEE